MPSAMRQTDADTDTDTEADTEAGTDAETETEIAAMMPHDQCRQQ